ncbi:5-oxoprolinase subunit PxpA [Aquimarina hainanensis]|uniref:5-oxoprolinase subunit PxpA n=1 Tax=Aquimarina hainanensis TaxID=1578017 RepID=A0ABW5NDA6_9FLAO
MKKNIWNADVGEEAGFDHEIMPYISWCNISCGVHAGNDDEIKKTIDLAIANDVAIGAHPSYPDRKNFGRLSMDISMSELEEILTNQVLKVKKYVEERGKKMHHVKPHGALYNDAVIRPEIAEVIVNVVKNVDRRLFVLTSGNSMIETFMEEKNRIKKEVFADRNYTSDLQLVSRKYKEAVITEPEKVYAHVKEMVYHNRVLTIEGVRKNIFFDTICVHGDNPKSVAILKYVTEKINRNL